MRLPQKNNKQKGFTLIEMLTVLAIFAVLTSIVVFNYGKFTSQTILTNMAYEVALSVREAQIYGVSVRDPNGSTSGDFSHQYGVHFDKGSASYYVFADANTGSEGIADGGGCETSGSECVKSYKLQRGMIINDVRIDCANKNFLNVSFKRPNPEARFNNAFDIPSADIEIKAPSGELRYVVIRNNGQIFVSRDLPTNTELSCS